MSANDDTDPIARLRRENDFLASAIAALEAKLPDAEDLAYLRTRRLADDRAAWAWKTIRLYMPWVTAVVSTAGAAAYWVATHLQFRDAS